MTDIVRELMTFLSGMAFASLLLAGAAWWGGCE